MASHRSATSRGKRRRLAPRLEMMEDRQLLAAAIPGVTLDPALVPKFVNPLPDVALGNHNFEFQPTGTADVTLQNGLPATVPLYNVGAFQIDENLGLGLTDPMTNQPIKTTVYGYGTSADDATYPGRSFVVQSGQPIAVQWTNGLTSQTHVVQAVDTTVPGLKNSVQAVDPTVLDGASTDPNVVNMSGPDLYFSATRPTPGPTASWNVTFPDGIPMVPHVHGGHTQAIYDGTPLQWFTPTTTPTTGVHGTDFPGQTTSDGPGQSTFTYDNSQQAGTIWYHDHAMGVTRLNVYAGLAGFYITHDKNETDLITTDTVANVLPNEKFDIPLAIQDRMFTAPGVTGPNDPKGLGGQLYYPADVLPGTTASFPSVHPEFFGDTILVDGQAWPVMDVEPRSYRFRILDGSDSRFYDLFLSSGQRMMQIGTDGGLLAQPVALSHLTIAPGERADVVIDFSKLAGQTIILRNNAKGPFPHGAPAFPGTTGQIMAFRVGPSKSSIPDATLTKNTTGLNPNTPSFTTADVNNMRQLGLFETTDDFGRLIQKVGPNVGDNKIFPDPAWFGSNDFVAQNYVSTTMNPITVVKQGDIEEWQIFNTTADTHPIHLHQVQFQVVSRQKFTWTVTNPTTGEFKVTGLTGNPRPPAANEAGWKDTVQMNPGEVTIIRAKFDLPGKYVWHCHILEHEEHDMMNEYVVDPPTASSQPAAQPANSSNIVPALALAPSVAAVSPPGPTNSPFDPLAAEAFSPTKKKQ